MKFVTFISLLFFSSNLSAQYTFLGFDQEMCQDEPTVVYSYDNICCFVEISRVIQFLEMELKLMETLEMVGVVQVVKI